VIGLLLLACLAEEDFRVEADAAVCDWKADCYGEVYQDCVDDAAGSADPVDDDCAYVPRQAQQCLTGLEELACPEALEDPEEDFGFPSACDEVWDCGDDT